MKPSEITVGMEFRDLRVICDAPMGDKGRRFNLRCRCGGFIVEYGTRLIADRRWSCGRGESLCKRVEVAA